MGPLIHSKIYVGHITHRRFLPKKHSFTYSIYMLALDVTEMEQQCSPSWLFGYSSLNPLKFFEKDYLKSEPGSLKQRITNKVTELAGDIDIARITMLVQVRCFGIYFSPANFYFCYDKNEVCTHMLAEVSNTPWNERHYYLVNMTDNNSDHDVSDTNEESEITPKNFHVSPFMDLNMDYHWRVKSPQTNRKNLLIHIENKHKASDNNGKSIFDVTLNLRKLPFSKKALWHVWRQLPVMTIKVVAGIYWQALKLFIKRIPFLSYQGVKPSQK